VRNTPDIDLLVRREDLPAITAVLEEAGFMRVEASDMMMFLDGPNSKPSEAIHLLFAGEKVRTDQPLPFPNIVTINDPAGYHVIELDALVSMKLLAQRLKDQVHLRDLIGVGLIDRSWLAKLPPVLAQRLQNILDTPEA